jgi:hypothetical protein
MKTPLTACVFVSLFGFCGVAFGAPETFILDQENSTLTISATISTALGSIPLSEAGSGSLTTHFNGTLQTDTTDTSIRFLPQSEVHALDSGSWRPGIDGADETAPASFAGKGQISTFLGTVLGEAALRSLVLNTSSDALPVNGQGMFDASLLLFAFPESSQARFDYRVSGLLNKTGGKPLAGNSSVSSSGGQTLLTLPIDIEGVATILEQDDFHFRLQGQLVAVKSGAPSNPEPFEVSAFSVTPTMGTFQIRTVPGKSYRIISSNDLAHWTTVIDEFIAAAASSKRDVALPALPNQYFRIEEN